MKFFFCDLAATPTVPDPKNGSNTTPSGRQADAIGVSHSFSGNVAKCDFLKPVAGIFQTHRLILLSPTNLLQNSFCVTDTPRPLLIRVHVNRYFERLRLLSAKGSYWFIPTFTPSLNSQDYFTPAFATSSEYYVDSAQPGVAGASAERQWTEVVWSDQYRFVRRYPQRQPDLMRCNALFNFQAMHTMSIVDMNYNQLFDLVTYHAITYTVTGSITGYTGDGSGIGVGLYRAYTKDMLMTGSTEVGGTYTFTWYDNTNPVFVEALEGGAKAGRSIDTLAQ